MCVFVSCICRVGGRELFPLSLWARFALLAYIANLTIFPRTSSFSFFVSFFPSYTFLHIPLLDVLRVAFLGLGLHQSCHLGPAIATVAQRPTSAGHHSAATSVAIVYLLLAVVVLLLPRSTSLVVVLPLLVVRAVRTRVAQQSCIGIVRSVGGGLLALRLVATIAVGLEPQDQQDNQHHRNKYARHDSNDHGSALLLDRVDAATLALGSVVIQVCVVRISAVRTIWRWILWR